MSRWHESDCAVPNIVVGNDGTPRCDACGCSPPLKELIAAAARADPFPPPPDNEPLDQMNLHWPLCVPYLRHGLPYVSSSSAGTVEAVTPRPCYEPTLGPEQFRLLNISAPPQVDWPIHCSLETYARETCPEYETVSYTWGGEENNNEPAMPVYVGPHWDVLLQTKNCWNMLHHMRPRRGFRLIWVDAICINQKNVEERNNQVRIMSSIYSQCLRVVIYLGPDVALPDTRAHNQPYPVRRAFHTLLEEEEDGDSASDLLLRLQALLQRRYFSRVWIIQELILPRLISVRIGTTDYIIDAVTAKKLQQTPSRWDWFETRTPWLQSACLGSLQHDETFYETLRMRTVFDKLAMTWKSQAGDPRDRLFGVMGLLGLSPSHSNVPVHPDDQGPKADYSISEQHLFTGFFAYQLTVLHDYSILLHAVGISGLGRMPSWIPDWQSPSGPAKQSSESLSLCSRFEDLSETPNDAGVYEYREISERRGKTYQPEVIYWRNKMRLLEGDLQHPPQEIAVNAATGGLCINLVHLLKLPSGPVGVSNKYDRWGETAYKFRGSHPRWFSRSKDSFYLVGEEGLESVIDLQTDHVFVFVLGPSLPVLPMAMCPCDEQPTDQEPRRLPRRWRLVATFSALYIIHDKVSEISIFDKDQTVPDLMVKTDDEPRGVFDPVTFRNNTLLGDAERQLHDVVADDVIFRTRSIPIQTPKNAAMTNGHPSTASNTNTKDVETNATSRLPKEKVIRGPGDNLGRKSKTPGLDGSKTDALHLFQLLLDEDKGDRPNGTFMHQFVRWLGPARRPRILGETFSLQRPDAEWSLRDSLRNVPVALFEDDIRDCNTYKKLEFLEWLTNRRALDVLETGFLPEDGYIPALYWPMAVIRDLNLDGRRYDVQIV